MMNMSARTTVGTGTVGISGNASPLKSLQAFREKKISASPSYRSYLKLKSSMKYK